jgi:outer membrane protein
MSYSLSGSRTDNSFALAGGQFATANALRFSINYPVFNGFVREENVTRASVAESNAQAALRDSRLAAHQQLTQFVGSLRLAEERVAIQVASVAAAVEDLRVQNQRYALGASTLLDVLTSQAQLNSARSALIQARYDARVAKAQIEALIGRDLK